jgi:3-oxoacyl-[acyl-carrier-protein] synthase-1/3-oxoacyl-[acyl-carrier-protein] synthase II
MGIISPLGRGLDETLRAIGHSECALTPLQLFPTSANPLPVGEIQDTSIKPDLPRTHTLALIAAEEAMQSVVAPPDAIIIGTTTGGMTWTEELLLADEKNPAAYSYHGTATIAEAIARRWGCRGPALTVSTACSSGSVALKLAFELLRSGRARRVLAGGSDALCRLTYYGFHSLQLVDPTGAHPFDAMRRGMTVGEGAAMLCLEAADETPVGALAEFCGGGLSCDAYHSAAPHPDGEGALQAMVDALADAGLTAGEIDYIHLHGTGTADNDLAEGRAIHALLGSQPPPPLSSLKGAYGHALAAAGAMGAVMSVLGLWTGFVPANTGLRSPDPQMNLMPEMGFSRKPLRHVLSNAFGFGGNNACLVFGKADLGDRIAHRFDRRNLSPGFFVHGRACLTAAGDTEQTLAHVQRGKGLAGMVPHAAILSALDEKAVRRLKRLPRLVLSLAVSACRADQAKPSPGAVFFGTGWGGLSETYDFLKKLFDTGARFASPTDFIGSVHNAPAGQAAIHFQAKGENITATGGDCSFEQALCCADLLHKKEPFLLIGADEYHETLSPLFDLSAALSGAPSDGGGAFYLSTEPSGAVGRIRPAYMAFTDGENALIPDMVSHLGGAERIRDQFALILAGVPAAHHEEGIKQLQSFLSATGFAGNVVEYRRFLGEYASASTVATVLAVSFVEQNRLPTMFCPVQETSLNGKGVLIMGFGRHLTALEVSPC